MNDSLFTTDARNEPYWWMSVPRPVLPRLPLPVECDVAVIGSGYTGLAAALELARNGRHVVVLDAEDAGWGCSTRNGGQVSTSVKPTFAELSARHGAEVAFGIRREGLNALEWIGEFIAHERIDCDFARVGRFHAAHSARAYEALTRTVAHQPPGLEVEVHAVPRAEQHREVGTDRYFGGLVYPSHASLHPAKFHQGLLLKAQQAGVTLAARCSVSAIGREQQRFRLHTSRGPISAREVIVASNGYTGAPTPWLRRRIIPIGSYIIATEPLPQQLARRLIPNNRVLTDTRKVVFYYRLSEDGRRLLFGGRVAAREMDSAASAPRLHWEMSRLFPELAASRISHSWGGFVAYTFDALPHLGRHTDGIHYCMGYCGSGVSLAPYFGTRLAQQILGKAEGRTALDGLAFQTRPLYWGNPWFLPAVVAYYRMRDRFSAARGDEL
jgi:glycine/D-amino acid oxidase-like deaminating enzyme